MEEWLHCNECAVRFSNKCCSFFVTNCAHIFCSKCEQKATNPSCVVCHQRCKVTPLNDKIQASLAEFFKPPSDLRKKAMDLLKRAEEVTKFQNNQLKLLRKKESGMFEEQKKIVHGTMKTIEQLQKENNETKKLLLRTKANNCGSPSRMAISHSPERSPRHSPSVSPRRVSPSGHQYKTSSQCYSSVPSSPFKQSTENNQHVLGKPYKPLGEYRRVSIRSPPVDGKLCMQSPSNISPIRGHPYKPTEGIVSRQAVKSSSPQQPLNTGLPIHKHVPSLSPNSFGTTPPSTPKYTYVHGYGSCPVTPDNRMSFYTTRYDGKR